MAISSRGLLSLHAQYFRWEALPYSKGFALFKANQTNFSQIFRHDRPAIDKSSRKPMEIKGRSEVGAFFISRLLRRIFDKRFESF